jgi:hypothetical protein
VSHDAPDDGCHERGLDVKLRRNRGPLVLALVCVLGGVMLLALPHDGRVLRTAVAVGGVLLGGVALIGALRPFRFAIGPEGLDVRRPGLQRTIRWDEIDALALDQPPRREGRLSSPRLLAVPAAGVTLGLPPTGHHPVDGRAAVELLDLEQVRDRPEEVAAALTRFAGDRFVDVPERRRAAFGAEDFPVGLRGYRTDVVDQLIRRGQDALVWGGTLERQGARSEIEQARAAGLPVAQRGYAVGQVDDALSALCAALADERSADRRTSS